MSKIVIKEWPYPEQAKAMLLRVGNPVYDGNGNWHTDVIFRSISKEDKKVTLDWGLLPMLKTGQIFSDGTKLYDQTNKKIAAFTFSNVEFKFFVDQIMTETGIVQRPAFRAKLGDTYYHIPAIELVRSFFARTRRLAYALLEANSILPLCQCQISTYPVKQVVVHLSPDCPSVLASEKWISTLVWMATDSLAQKSWDSFFHYFKSCQGLNVFPKNEEEIPVFPLAGEFSLTCGYRSYGKNIWLDEIIKVDCDNVDFDEIVVEKYTAERSSGNTARIISLKKSDKIEIINSAQSALSSYVEADIDLPNFMFKKQPRISIIKKSIGVGNGIYGWTEKAEASIVVTGKNDGFTDAKTGLEFSPIDKDTPNQLNNGMLIIAGLKEAEAEYSVYNQTLAGYLEVMCILSQKHGIAAVGTTIFELPDTGSFAWICPYFRRCCAVSTVTLSTGELVNIIEIDRTIQGSSKKWHVATLFLSIRDGDLSEILRKIITNLVDESGHWADWRLSVLKKYIRFKRLKHSNQAYEDRWVERIFNNCIVVSRW